MYGTTGDDAGVCVCVCVCGGGGGQSVLHYCSSDVILSFNRAVQTGQEKK